MTVIQLESFFDELEKISSSFYLFNKILGATTGSEVLPTIVRNAGYIGIPINRKFLSRDREKKSSALPVILRQFAPGAALGGILGGVGGAIHGGVKAEKGEKLKGALKGGAKGLLIGASLGGASTTTAGKILQRKATKKVENTYNALSDVISKRSATINKNHPDYEELQKIKKSFDYVTQHVPELYKDIKNTAFPVFRK